MTLARMGDGYDLFLIYEALYENGFTHSNIHVLYGDGNDFQSSHTRYQVPSEWGVSQITDRPNSESDIQDVLSDVSSVMTAQDFLWVWWMEHGGPDPHQGGCPNIYFEIENTGELVYDHEFASYVDQITNYERGSSSVMTCHSGAIIDDLKNNKTVTLTAVPCGRGTSSDQYDVWHAQFTYNLFCALDWETPGGSPVDADDNSNGLVSMYEAWDYTSDNRTWRSDPQYSDLGNIGPKNKFLASSLWREEKVSILNSQKLLNIYAEAIELFQYVISNFPGHEGAKYSLLQLIFCYEMMGRETEIILFLEGIAAEHHHQGLGLSALAQSIPYLERDGEPQEALNRCRSLMGRYREEQTRKDLLFQMGNIYLYGLEDETGAEKTFREFIDTYPGDDLAVIAQAKLALLGVSAPTPKPTQEGVRVAERPQVFHLFQDHPNPFNPLTSIQYSVANAQATAGYVTLKIYNILGQEVSTLVDEVKKEAGLGRNG